MRIYSSLGEIRQAPLRSIFRDLFRAGLAASLILFGDCAVDSQAGGASLVSVPNPLSGDNPRYPLLPTDAPEPGASLTDSRLGTTQRRVVAAEGLRHEYARHDPFNRDCSKVLLLAIAEGRWNVYRTTEAPYDQAGNFVRSLEAEEPRWDRDDPNALFATQEFRIFRINVETGESSVIKDFRADPILRPILESEPDLYRITMKDEGEASRDRRYWAFIVQGANDDYRARYLLVWDRDTDRVLGIRKLTLNESRIDWVGMSPLGNWVLIGAEHDNGGELAGFVMTDRSLKHFYPLHYSTGHADVGLDSDGNEVVVMQNAQTDYIDLIPLEPSTRPIPPGGGYEGTGHVPLVRLFYASDSPIGFNSGVHVSCNFPGWCVVSTHIEPGVPEKNWLDRSIILVRLDRTRPRGYYLTKVYGSCRSYWEETHAAVSGDGSRVVWATNWGRQAGEDKVWLMELKLPVGWSFVSVPAGIAPN